MPIISKNPLYPKWERIWREEFTGDVKAVMTEEERAAYKAWIKAGYPDPEPENVYTDFPWRKISETKIVGDTGRPIPENLYKTDHVDILTIGGYIYQWNEARDVDWSDPRNESWRLAEFVKEEDIAKDIRL